MGTHLKQSPKIDPVGWLREELIEVRFREVRKIVSRWPVNDKLRLALCIQFYCGDTGRMLLHTTHVSRWETHLGHTLQNLLAPLIRSHSTDEANRVAQFCEVRRKVKRCSTQMLLWPDNIPENLAYTDDL